MAETKEKLIYVTPVGRLSFPALFAPEKADEDSEPKYQATILITKGTDLSPLKAMIEQAIKDKWGAKRPPNLHIPVRDGAEKAHIAGYGEDVVFLRAKSKYRPQVLDAHKRVIDDVEVAYAGCNVKFVIEPYAYEHPKGGKGVGLTLHGVQKVGDNEPFGSSVDVNEWFNEEAPQEAAPAAGGYDW